MPSEADSQNSIDENVRRRFESAWQQGRPATIESCLEAASPARQRATLEELVFIELELAWKYAAERFDGYPFDDPPRVESYVSRFPALSAPETLRELVDHEYRMRHRYGDRPGIEEYRARFPGLSLDSPTSLAGSDSRPAGHPDIPGYEILGTLGQGGMGVVYKARHVKLHRLVALKMLLGGADAAVEERARFLTEAEAVAGLRHPNIVQIYEFGEHAGHMYLSLEFVEGGTLADRLEGTPQPPRAAAELVETLARTMDAAHRNQVVHRDLKPANVLLTGDGTPKVTDFGLAKRLEGAPAQTKTGDLMGTPSYMAPEQAEGRTREINAAADIYALGAVLYEMLTGRPPFRAETPWNTLSQVVHDEPVPAIRLQPRVPRDLDTICLKCLEKLQHLRYPSAGELADDLRRFLDGETIRARPASLWLRGVKWVRRRPVTAALVTVSSLALCVLIAGSLWYNHRLEGALGRERTQREEAQENFEQARLAVDRMLTRVARGPLAKLPHMQAVSRKLLEDALGFYDRFLEQKSDDPLVRREAARAYRHVGDIRMRVGLETDAEESFRAARGLLDALIEEFPDRPEYQLDLADLTNNHALLLASSGRTDAAEKGFRDCVAAADGLVGRFSGVERYRTKRAQYRHGLATLLSDAGRLEEAEPELRSAIATLEELPESERASVPVRNLLAQASSNLGLLLRRTRRADEARDRLEQAIAIKTRLAAEFPAEPGFRNDLANSHNTLGILLWDLGKNGEARESYGRALPLQRQLARDFPSTVEYHGALASTLHNLAELSLEDGQADRARELLEESVGHQSVTLRFQPQDATYRRQMYNHRWALAEAAITLGEHDRAAANAARLPALAPEGHAGYRLAAELTSRCIPLVEKDPEVPPKRRDSLTRAYADRALAWLGSALDRGYREPAAKLWLSAPFRPLHGRSEFREILQRLTAAAAAGDD